MSTTIPGITEVYIPETITVHLGNPDEPAENVTLNYRDYIANVASSELYPTWPEQALRANIYAINSIAMNRIYTEWYRSRGYNFDITNSTQYDQAFVKDRGIFDNISNIVDDIFDEYVIREGRIEPLFTRYCDGRISQCEGMYQWGSVDLANEGYNAFDILRYYYGDHINLVKYSPVGNVATYPGTPLKLGDKGIYVMRMQLALNIISTNYPKIPKTTVDSTFTPELETAVKTFQEIFSLPVTGQIDKSTWYKIRSIYVAVAKLAELTSRGALLKDLPLNLPAEIPENQVVPAIQLIQYLLNLLSSYYNTIPAVPIDGIMGPVTRNSIIEFQKTVNLPPTGKIDNPTYYSMYSRILAIIVNLPPNTISLPRLIYPGTIIKRGSEGPDVLIMQEYLAYITTVIPGITLVPYNLVDGIFGPITEAAVTEFQRQFGLVPNGIVDAMTWNTIVDVYRNLRFGEARTVGQFPGTTVQ